eukprot:UC4_evm1s285
MKRPSTASSSSRRRPLMDHSDNDLGDEGDESTDLRTANPVPSPNENDDNDDSDYKHAFEEYLSERVLRELSGVDDLASLAYLEMKVDTTDSSLGRFGRHLPALRQLKLSNSIIGSVRDLGTTLQNITVLWMARCGLSDLDGISAFPKLRELYLAFNNITDCSSISLLDDLEVLDREGNRIRTTSQIEFLGLCPSLRSLTLEGNPICASETYRAQVRDTLPDLQKLDDLSVDVLNDDAAFLAAEASALLAEVVKS